MCRTIECVMQKFFKFQKNNYFELKMNYFYYFFADTPFILREGMLTECRRTTRGCCASVAECRQTTRGGLPSVAECRRTTRGCWPSVAKSPGDARRHSPSIPRVLWVGVFDVYLQCEGCMDAGRVYSVPDKRWCCECTT